MENKNNGVTSVYRVFGILEELSDKKEIGLIELSNKLYMSKSTVFRFLQTMKELGYVNQDEVSEKYSLSTKLYGLGSRALGTYDLNKIANRHMHYLSEKLKETVHLAILDIDSKSLIYIHKENYNYTLTMMSQVGKKAPLHCTGLGKALLAFSPEEVIDNILKDYKYELYTTSTIKDEQTFRAELKIIKDQGYAEDINEHEEKIHCIAVPIFDQFDNSIAAISVSWSEFRYQNADIKQAFEEIYNCANLISKELGRF